MTLITRCPACETMFKIVPDQLRISEGWARCGQCGEVFDASEHLVPAEVFESGAQAGDIALDLPDSESAGSRRALTPTAGPEPFYSDPVVAAAPPLAPHPVEPQQPASQAALHDGDLAPAIARIDPREAERPASDPPAPAVPVLPVRMPPEDEDSEFQSTRTEEDARDVSFMRDGKKQSVWRKPIVRIGLLLLVLFLVALLAAQFLLHERNRIAAVEPATRPLLMALCALSRCELAPLRQIESIVIDSSSFTLIRGDTYRLSFSLRNKAPLDLSMPALELALTDAQDQTVVRRVITPTEFASANRLLTAGSDLSSSLSLSVKPTTTVERISGYRLFAFYP